MRRLRRFGLALSATLAPSAAAAQNAAPAPAQACSAAEHRQFDFWIGEWNVARPDGQQVGTSRITRIADGCGVLEEWRAAGGPTGVSINMYDAADRKWHQHWVGGGGMILHLSGGFHEGAMEMTAERDTPNGRVRDRVRWTAQPDGAVRQHWDTTADGGKTWTTVFLGVYKPAGRSSQR